MKKFFKHVVDFLKKYVKYFIVALIFLVTLQLATKIVDSWKYDMLYDLRTQVYRNENAIDDLERDISRRTDDISELEDYIYNELEEDISELEDYIYELEYDISELY